MNITATQVKRLETDYNPIQLLHHLAYTQTTGCLQVVQRAVEWKIYLFQGQLIYATHSIKPEEKWERHLHRLSLENSKLTDEVCQQTQLLLQDKTQNHEQYNPEYETIRWLWEQQHITTTEANQLICNLTQEALESFLLLEEVNYRLLSQNVLGQPFKLINLYQILDICQQRLAYLKSFCPQVMSPYDCVYLVDKKRLCSQPHYQKYQEISQLLIGFTFRQLASFLNQDELTLINDLLPLIQENILVIESARQPFDKLPNTNNYVSSIPEDSHINLSSTLLKNSATTLQYTHFSDPQKIGNIVYVDDSKIMLKSLKELLSKYRLNLYLIQDSLKAFVEIIRLSPDLILLDIDMPHLDGFHLCRLLRKHPEFFQHPIIMLTDNNQIIDKVKAKLVGANDCLTKPCTRQELEKIVFKYLPLLPLN